MSLTLCLSRFSPYHPSDGRTRVYCITLFFLAILQSVTGCRSSPDPAVAEKSLTPLAAGMAIRGSFLKPEIHQYGIHLESGRYFRALIDHSGSEMVVTILGPKGDMIAEAPCRDVGPTPLSLIAGERGIYRLRIRSLSGAGEYRLSSEPPRAPEDRDRIRIEAERASTEAEKLQRESRSESYVKAIRKYEKALAAWEKIGDLREQACSLKNIGEIYASTGRNRKAPGYYDRALSLSRLAGDRRLETEILNRLSQVHSHFGNTDLAEEYGYEALRLSHETKNKRGEARSFSSLGDYFYTHSYRQEALTRYCEALIRWNDLNDPAGRAQTLLDIGQIYADLSYDRKARAFYDRALVIWKAVRDRKGEALTLNAIAGLHTKSGAAQKALDLSGEAEELLEITGDRAAEARVLQFKAYTFYTLGEMNRALENYDQALQIWREIGDPHNETGALITIGIIHNDTGDYKAALSNLEQALKVNTAYPDRKVEPHIHKNLGSVFDNLGRKHDALLNYRKALKLHRANGYKRGVAEVMGSIGSLYADLGDTKQAIRTLTEALNLQRETGLRIEEAGTLYNFSRVELDLRRYNKARHHIESAIEIVETLRTNVASPDLRASYFASIHKYFGLYIDLLMRLDGLNPGRGFDAAALEISERARARNMLESLTEARVDIRRGVDRSLLEHENRLQKQLNEKEEQRLQLSGGRGSAEQIAALKKEIGRLTDAYHDLQGRIRAASPQYAALTQTGPLSAKEIQQLALDDDTLLLEYSLGDRRSYVWAVTKSSISGFVLPKRKEIESLLVRAYNLLHQPPPGREEADRQFQVTAAELSRKILGPVADQLGNRRLLIVADGALQYIPFGALPIPDSQNAKRSGNSPPVLVPLVERHVIVTMPSASALAVLRHKISRRRPAEKAVAIFADPVFDLDDIRVINGIREQASRQPKRTEAEDLRQILRDFDENDRVLPRLQSSIGESDGIASKVQAGDRLTLTGFDASRANAVSPELSRYRIIHFATHGLLNSEHPELSGIVLSLVDRQGKPQNGVLRLYDIYNLNLPADLVVLSACRTALGKDVTGEGLIGLTRGFMYAGAARVVASLWKVDDEATAEFMKIFYRQKIERGLPAAVALTEAQREFRSRKRWQSPYYWSAFILHGEWR